MSSGNSRSSSMEDKCRSIEKEIREAKIELADIPDELEYLDERTLLQGKIESLEGYLVTELLGRRNDTTESHHGNRVSTPISRKRSFDPESMNISASANRQAKYSRAGSPSSSYREQRLTLPFGHSSPSSSSRKSPSNREDEDYNLAFALQQEEYAAAKQSGPPRVSPNPNRPSQQPRKSLSIPQNIETIDLLDDDDDETPSRIPFQRYSSSKPSWQPSPSRFLKSEEVQIIPKKEPDVLRIPTLNPVNGSPFNPHLNGISAGLPRMPGAFPSPSTGLPPFPLGLDDMFDAQLDADWNNLFPQNRAEMEEDIKSILENIRSNDDFTKRKPTPAALSVTLRPHQEVALAWLNTQEDSRFKGGILADDMGLGKTVSMLALIIDRKSKDPKQKTNLIVTPVALMRQWEREIERKIKPAHKLRAYIHHGQNRKKINFSELSKFDIVLTSYGTLAAEFRRLTKWRENKVGVPVPDKEFLFFGVNAKFYRIILDEAQAIKNRNTQSSNACSILKAEYRWILSGTPMQNSPDELFPYLRYLGTVHPYTNFPRFKRDFSVSVMSNRNESAMTRLRALIASIMLRRRKEDPFEGKPIIELPPKHIEIVHSVFSKDEKEFYTALENRASIQINKYVSEGTLGEHFSNMLVLLLRLRQTCLHPHLIKDIHERRRYENGKSEEENLRLIGMFSDYVVKMLKEKGAEGFECPVCYDISENSALIVPCGHRCCHDCIDLIIERKNRENEIGDDGADARCPTCRGILKKELTVDFESFRKVHMPTQNTIDDILGIVAGEDDSSSDSDSDSESDEEEDGYESEGSDLGGFIVPDDEDDEDDEDEESKKASDSDVESDDDEFLNPDGSIDIQKLSKSKKSKRLSFDREDSEDIRGHSRRTNKGKGKDKAKPKRSAKKPRKGQTSNGRQTKSKQPKIRTLADERRLAQRNKKAKKKYLKKLKKNFIPSSKTDKALEIVNKIDENHPGEKILIFSAFTAFLDLMEVPLSGEGIKYLRYDGSMSIEERNEAVEKFTDEEEYTVMLISLKAGNSGLNLFAANHIIIMEPFWNPFVEYQAIDRAHRFGQEREVYVHRIIIEGTVEDRILQLQEQKRDLVESAMDEKHVKGVRGLGMKELGFLFGIDTNQARRRGIAGRAF